MEFLPILNEQYTGPFFRFEQTAFNHNSYKEIKELFELVRECINGSCTAIIANGEILYNTYDPTRIASRILMDDMLREQFAKNPQLLILPYEKLNIVIHMFFMKPWCITITFNNGFYNINCFSH